MVIKQFTHDFKPVPWSLEATTEANGYRVYKTPSGASYPSVTTILGEMPKPGLDAWRKRVGVKKAESITKDAAKRGKATHGFVEDYLRNKPVVFDNPFHKSLFNKIHSTLNNIDNIKLIETSLYSDKLQMAGTPDCIAEFAKELCVIDFKTSIRLKEERYIGGYFMQCAAYAIMYQEHFGVRPKNGVIIISVEESNVPQVFKKPIEECLYMLKEYVVELTAHRQKMKSVI